MINSALLKKFKKSTKKKKFGVTFNSLTQSLNFVSRKSVKNKTLEIDSEFSERNYTIVGALFSGSVAYLLFASQSAYQELELTELRLATLLVFAAILPFQGAYLIIHTYVQRYRTLLDEQKMITLTKLAELCRMIGYLSVLGFTLSLININLIIGGTFIFSVFLTIILVRWYWNHGLLNKPDKNDFEEEKTK